jgi:hypothetical protein
MVNSQLAEQYLLHCKMEIECKKSKGCFRLKQPFLRPWPAGSEVGLLSPILNHKFSLVLLVDNFHPHTKF